MVWLAEAVSTFYLVAGHGGENFHYGYFYFIFLCYFIYLIVTKGEVNKRGREVEGLESEKEW